MGRYLYDRKKGVRNIHYIVLDLEWNQNPLEKEKEISQPLFEIVEIGAQKLNEDYEIVDTFHCVINPVLYTQLNFYVKKIVPVTDEELRQGIDFKTAAKTFSEWCGKDYIFCTWGSMDLTELQRNYKYFDVKNTFAKPLIFYDIQKLFAIYCKEPKKRAALKKAVEYLNIESNEPFHRALADAYYTGLVMKAIDVKQFTKNYSIDLYRNPKNRQEEIYAFFDDYSKFVSKEFDSKEAVMKDSVVTTTRCCKCNKVLRKKIRWFSINGKIYYSLMYCDEHGWMKAKIRMKKNDEEKFFAIRTIKATDEAGVALIRNRQEEVRNKRRIRRQRK